MWGQTGPPLYLLLPTERPGFSATSASHCQRLGRPGPTDTQGHGDREALEPAVPARGGLGLSPPSGPGCTHWERGLFRGKKAQPPSWALPPSQHCPSGPHPVWSQPGPRAPPRHQLSCLTVRPARQPPPSRPSHPREGEPGHWPGRGRPRQTEGSSPRHAACIQAEEEPHTS